MRKRGLRLNHEAGKAGSLPGRDRLNASNGSDSLRESCAFSGLQNEHIFETNRSPFFISAHFFETKWSAQSISAHSAETKWSAQAISAHRVETNWSAQSISANRAETKWSAQAISAHRVEMKWSAQSILALRVETKIPAQSISAHRAEPNWCPFFRFGRLQKPKRRHLFNRSARRGPLPGSRCGLPFSRGFLRLRFVARHSFGRLCFRGFAGFTGGWAQAFFLLRDRGLRRFRGFCVFASHAPRGAGLRAGRRLHGFARAPVAEWGGIREVRRFGHEACCRVRPADASAKIKNTSPAGDSCATRPDCSVGAPQPLSCIHTMRAVDLDVFQVKQEPERSGMKCSADSRATRTQTDEANSRRQSTKLREYMFDVSRLVLCFLHPIEREYFNPLLRKGCRRSSFTALTHEPTPVSSSNRFRGRRIADPPECADGLCLPGE